MSTTEPLDMLETTDAHPKYDEYKNSGVEWLGDIPSNWSVTKLKRVSEIESGTGFPESEQGSNHGDLPFFKVSDMNLDSNSIWMEECENYVTVEVADRLGAQALPPKTIIFPKVGAALLTNKRRILERTSCVDNNIMGAVPSNCKAKYLYYWMCGLDLSRLANPGAVPSLNESQAEELPVLLPPRDEQRAISTFLDRETDRIDALIEKKEQLIDLLEEKRTALISRVVTKGLDGDVEMQDSGVEWLGEIPAHWKDARLKFVARLETGHTPSRSKDEYWENRTIPWVTLSDVGKLRDGTHDYIVETEEKISELGLENSSARLLPEGTVILSRTASVGFAAILGNPMATTQDFVNWICGDKLSPKYLLYCFRSMRQEFDRITDGSTHETIYMPEVERFRIPLPPLEEQREIADHLDRKTDQIDALARKVNQAIERLKEYRTALISAAVTGQIDVRGEIKI